MLQFFQQMTVNTKLWIMWLTLAIPLAVVSFFMDLGFVYDINIARRELQGVRVTAALSPALRMAPSHYALFRVDKGEQAIEDEQFVREALDSAAKNLKALEEPMLYIPESTTALSEAQGRLAYLNEIWRSIEADPGSGVLYASFMSEARLFLEAVANVSFMEFDPVPDSNNLAEMLNHGLPAYIQGLHGAARLMEKNIGGVDQAPLVALMQGIESRHIKNSAVIVIREDANYYGSSPTLESNFKTAFKNFIAADDLLRRKLMLHLKGQRPQGIKKAWIDALDAATSLQHFGLIELNYFLQQRINSYRAWLWLAISCGLTGLMLAFCMAWLIAQSVTRPINQLVAYADAVSKGNLEFDPPEAKGRDMVKLLDGVVSMVNDLKRLALFPRENPSPVFEARSDGVVTYQNRSAEDFLKEYGLELYDFLPSNHLDLVQSSLGMGHSPHDIVHQAGPKTFGWRYNPVREHDIVHIYAFDITEQVSAQEQLVHNAFHDELTGLPNRSLFMDRLEQAIGRSLRQEINRFAILYIDLDHFKHINESLGHDAGDILLKTMAERMAKFVHYEDTLARLGGDEFALMLAEISGAERALQVAHRMLDTMSRSLSIADYTLSMTASIGLVVWDHQYENAMEMLRDADTAMYKAKGAGRGQVVLFEEKLHRKAHKRLEMEIELKKALDLQQLEVYYQPLVSLTSGGINGFEALIRWPHPEKGMIMPGQFIPIAEETGLIVPLGRFVMQQACMQAAKWQQLIPEMIMSVNLSVRQFTSDSLLEDLRRALGRSGLPPHLLKIEITESAVMGNAEESERLLKSFHDLGVKTSIDDFGTGYSSLSYLTTFSFDYLKVDQSFVSRMDDSEGSRIVETIISLAHDLGKRVIAEGIETPQQLEALRDMGSEYGQGYLFSKPVPASEAEALIKKGKLW